MSKMLNFNELYSGDVLIACEPTNRRKKIRNFVNFRRKLNKTRSDIIRLGIQKVKAKAEKNNALPGD